MAIAGLLRRNCWIADSVLQAPWRPKECRPREVAAGHGGHLPKSANACWRFRRVWARQPTLHQHIDAKDAAIGQIDQEVDAYVEPFRTAIEIEILSSIPGISDLSAQD